MLFYLFITGPWKDLLVRFLFLINKNCINFNPIQRINNLEMSLRLAPVKIQVPKHWLITQSDLSIQYKSTFLWSGTHLLPSAGTPREVKKTQKTKPNSVLTLFIKSWWSLLVESPQLVQSTRLVQRKQISDHLESAQAWKSLKRGTYSSWTITGPSLLAASSLIILISSKVLLMGLSGFGHLGHWKCLTSST